MLLPYLPPPIPIVQNRAKGHGGGGKLRRPSRQRQTERFGERFDRIERLLDEGRISELRSDPTSLAPERAIVFEVAGSGIPSFADKARQIGLEFLLEEEGQELSAPEFAVLDKQGRERPEKPVPARFYLVMPDETSLRELVSLWTRFRSGLDFPHGYTKWRDLFDHLIDVRPWGVRDRVSPEDQQFFREMLAYGDDLVRTEIEIWYSDSEEINARRFSEVTEAIERSGGELLAAASISEIRYSAILCHLPREAVEVVTNLGEIALLLADSVMFVKPQSSASLAIGDEGQWEAAQKPDFSDDLGPPLVALLDGMPIQNHELLLGRLEVDDPDALESRYSSVGGRRHGTEMSSLIIHGDLNRPGLPIRTRLHVRPIMCADGALGDLDQEHFPSEILVVDHIYRAVRRMFEGDGDYGPTAPTVKIVNISLGDRSRPFARRRRPWARVLDFLAWRYRVLFIVSAGNVIDDIVLPAFESMSDFQSASPDQREVACIQALSDTAGFRTMLSPSEAVNVLTVGACHCDFVDQGMHTSLVDPLISPNLPTIVSGLGLGFRSSIKPELLVSGGRTLLRARGSRPLRLGPVHSPGQFAGVGAAAPDAQGRLGQQTNIYGTSAAAALASRTAHQLIDAVLDSESIDIEDDLYWSLYAKALLVHHSRVDAMTYERLETLLRDSQSPQALKRDVARFLGFGTVPLDFEAGCAACQATMLGHGLIQRDQGHAYRIPLPQSLGGQVGYRAMTVTVAWFTPVNSNHQLYRMAKLEAKLPRVAGMDGNNTYQPDDYSRGKGSIFHAKFDGRLAASVAGSATCEVVVDCLAQAGELDDPIPYAIAVSFEVGVDSGIDLYADVRARLAVQVQGTP